MDSYFLLKFIHILSATVLTGTGIGIAFFMWMVCRSHNAQAIKVVARLVVLADWIFTAPAVVVQFISGVLLMQRLGYSYTSPWFITVLSLFIFIGLCWLPVVYIQYRLRSLAHNDNVESPAFFRLMRYWTLLGIPAFSSIIVMFWLMIFKPFAVA